MDQRPLTMSKAIHKALSDIEAHLARVEHERDVQTTPEVNAAIATIRAQANAIDPRQPAATVQPVAPTKGLNDHDRDR